MLAFIGSRTHLIYVQSSKCRLQDGSRYIWYIGANQDYLTVNCTFTYPCAGTGLDITVSTLVAS